MGNGMCLGRGSDPQSITSKEIDDKIRAISRKNNGAYNNIKIILLGPGESGKSTIFKQMKIIQDKEAGFSHEERLAFRQIVYANCMSQMKVLIVNAINFQFPFGNRDAAERLMTLYQQGQHMSDEIAKLISALWVDPAIQSVYELRGKKYQLNDTAEYFFKNVERIAKEEYVPSEEDILRARVRSTGIEEAQFHFEEFTFTVVDVGGQRSERRKWIHCFDSVKIVLFCASLSAYDQVLREDSSQNRMEEALLLFDEVVNQHFKEKPIILFLNKTDLFEDKYTQQGLADLFPDYNGESVDEGKQFIRDRFMEKADPKHKIFDHFTCALNTGNMKVVITSVRSEITKYTINKDIFTSDVI